MRWGIRQRGALRGWGRCCGRRWDGLWGAGPAQAAAGIIDHLGMGVEEFVCERFQLVVVELKLELEGAIGDAPALPQKVEELIEHGVEVHDCSPAAATTGTVPPDCED
jgi:hypothetical protein